MLDPAVHAEFPALPGDHLLEVGLILGAAHQPLVTLGGHSRPGTGFRPDQGKPAGCPGTVEGDYDLVVAPLLQAVVA